MTTVTSGEGEPFFIVVQTYEEATPLVICTCYVIFSQYLVTGYFLWQLSMYEEATPLVYIIKIKNGHYNVKIGSI